MKYVFDTSPFVSLFKNFYPSTFVTLWQNFDALIEAGEIVSTREVYREIEGQNDELKEWAKDHNPRRPVCTPPWSDPKVRNPNCPHPQMAQSSWRKPIFWRVFFSIAWYMKAESLRN